MARSLAVTMTRRLPRRLRVLILILLVIPLAGCFALPGQKAKEDADATIAALQSTINAAPTATSTSAATLTPLPTAIPPTSPPPTFALATPITAPISAVTPSQQSPSNIEDLILNSNILVYEDIAGNPDVFRYVAAALQRLGFSDGSYVDTGDAQGRFLQQISKGAPNGAPWDLIIIASEDRSGIQGTFFEVLEPILNTGKTAAILEAWHLDEIHQGTVKPILLRCGVDVVNWEGASSASLNVFALDPTSPLLNEVVRVTDFHVLDYWEWYFDLGDLMYTTGSGDARLVVGAEPGNTSQGGVVAECYDGRLVLQTLSSHNYADDTMVSLWANYIHYTLRRIHGG